MSAPPECGQSGGSFGSVVCFADSLLEMSLVKKYETGWLILGLSKTMMDSLRVLTNAACRTTSGDTTDAVVSAVAGCSRFITDAPVPAIRLNINVGMKRAAASKQAILPPR